jgi:hypothetical protein
VNDIKAYNDWRTNGELIADVAKLWFSKTRITLDPTYGKGTFWTVWRPRKLVACDKVRRKSPLGRSVDFRRLPFKDRQFSQVVFDPPYKLNGRPDLDSDERYGTDEYTRWQDRMDLIFTGLREVERVCKDILLVKCQDQVVSGHVRWQTHLAVTHAEVHGFGLVDRFDMLGGRKQPKDRSQVHARRNASTLLVFKRGHRS